MGRFAPKVPAADAPIRHLIAEYVHRARVVTCTCGYTCSSVSNDGGRTASDWDLHVRANRTVAI